MKEHDERKLRRIEALPQSFKETGKLMEASMDKNGIYFKVGQKVRNLGENTNEWIITEEDLLELNTRISQYSHLEVQCYTENQELTIASGTTGQYEELFGLKEAVDSSSEPNRSVSPKMG